MWWHWVLKIVGAALMIMTVINLLTRRRVRKMNPKVKQATIGSNVMSFVVGLIIFAIGQ